MSLGIIIDCSAVMIGAVLGSIFKTKLPENYHKYLPPIFGICSIAIAINSIIGAVDMTAVVLAILIGYCIGELLKLEENVKALFAKVFSKIPVKGDFDMEMFITVVALFSTSGFSWYAVLTESIAGNSEILITKSVLDFFTALLFGAVLGKRVALIPIFQIVVLSVVFLLGKVVSPYTTQEMFLNLSACGGILTFAAGLRVAKIKSIPLMNLVPALIIVMPITFLIT